VLARGNAALLPMCGGRAYQFECRMNANDGSPWPRFATNSYWNGYWVPKAEVRPAPGVHPSEVPECKD
jgi:hypothetical protein